MDGEQIINWFSRVGTQIGFVDCAIEEKKLPRAKPDLLLIYLHFTSWEHFNPNTILLLCQAVATLRNVQVAV